MTRTEASPSPAAGGRRRVRPLVVRQAAARMVIAANEANGEPTDPRILAVARGDDGS
ncbi:MULTISPECIES: hypothetical protein [unclassified Gordonia (in: high G+C Gram-positive bacteria)]|uniref:hypothetical protein n=1 Tax=unclassified Gordonia (in: high G+C Gram-positive bacteria) TaxID=2657482 RepID=UPI001F10C89C|nr:hypothetical protein [Gordonia sp. ABSL49_1]MCH5641760.1 hypothetical protein [Gordonia sp. ABSL49_1]